MKSKGSNIRWMERNIEKINILYNQGLSTDEIRVIASYIGSNHNDNREICHYCGIVFSRRKHNIIKKINTNPYYLDIVYLKNHICCEKFKLILEEMIKKDD